MRLARRAWSGLTMALCAATMASSWLGCAQAQGQPPPVASGPPPLSALPSILQLQPDQRDAWRTYNDAIAQDRAAHQSPIDLAQAFNVMQTPARLDAMLDQMKSDQAAFQRRAAATKAFYAVLTPDQKQTFDTITRLPIAPPAPPQYRPPQSTLPQPPNSQALPPPGRSGP